MYNIKYYNGTHVYYGREIVIDPRTNPCSKHVPRLHEVYLLPVARRHHLLYSATTMYLLIIALCIYIILPRGKQYSNVPAISYTLTSYISVHR